MFKNNNLVTFRSTYNYIYMLTFDQQDKILAQLLHRPTNKHCADCAAASPTWASLDFGVFVCSNCSGAHRALGPTITRIKSVNLDQWKTQWVENMLIGNEEVNGYWEGEKEAAESKKPNIASSPATYRKFVEDKYVRKKFVLNKSELDPLAASKTKPPIYMEKKTDIVVEVGKKKLDKKVVNLLEDYQEIVDQKTEIENNANSTQTDNEEFSDFVSCQPQNKVTSSNQTTISFDQLLNYTKTQPKQKIQLQESIAILQYDHPHYGQYPQHVHNPQYIQYPQWWSQSVPPINPYGSMQWQTGYN